MTLSLQNPHSALAALSSRPHDVLEIRVPTGKLSDGWTQVVDVARSHGVPVHTELSASSDRQRRPEKIGRQGGTSAVVRELPGVMPEDLWSQTAPAVGDVWLALDCLQDPHNVGAIFRTAAFFGIRGILLTRDRSAPLSSTVYDVASGGMEAVPFASVANLASTLKLAQQAGLWLLGSSEHAAKSVQDVPHDRPWLLVIGNEEHGLRRLTLDLCDETCSIPAQGAVGSLNASVAAGILMSSLVRG